MATASAKRGKKVIKVSLELQVLEAYEGVERIFRFECVTGSRDHPTDRGAFRVNWRAKSHVSNIYKVRMDFALFFTADGKAIHQYHWCSATQRGPLCKKWQ